MSPIKDTPKDPKNENTKKPSTSEEEENPIHLEILNNQLLSLEDARKEARKKFRDSQ